mgnify:CR=1 FL=1
MDGYIKLNIVNVITISIAALLGYGLLVGASLLLKKVSPSKADATA